MTRRAPHAWRILACALLLLPLWGTRASGDALVVTQAMKATTISEVFVDADAVRMELEIGVPDFRAFARLLPEELLAKVVKDPKPFEERLPAFFAEDLVVEADGTALEGRMEHLELRARVERDIVTGEPLPQAPDAQKEPVLVVRLRWPTATKPKTVVLRTTLYDRPTPPEVGFMGWHLGVPVSDFRYLPPKATLDLDWDDPWFSAFRHRNLRRGNAASVQAFLYVEPHEVRKEVVLRPRDLEGLVDLGLDGQDMIPVEKQEAVKMAVARYLMTRAPVLIDGKPAEPMLDRIHFLERSLRTTQVVDPPKPLPYLTATLGVIFAYPVEDWPKEVSMRWDLFPERMDHVPASCVDEAGGLPSRLTREHPDLVWTNVLTNPSKSGLAPVEAPPEDPGILRWIVLVAAGLAAGLLARRLLRERPSAIRAGVPVAIGGAVFAFGLGFWVPEGAMDEDRMKAVLTPLLRNVYGACDARGEERTYDLLARSVDGDLLKVVYLEANRSLVLENQGGARVRVLDVAVEEAQPSSLPGGGQRVRARWTIQGSVGHWGHVHQRSNRYDAVIDLEPREGAWKITGLELLDEQRVDAPGR